MNLQNISAWCIRNPIVPIVLFAGLILAGLISFSRMEVQNDPDIEFPAVRVTIAQPGAAPTEIEKQITQKVEAAVRTINGIESIGSTASEGVSNTGIQFQIGVDINEAVNEVKNAVDQARSDMPDGILEPQVYKLQGSSFPFAYYAISADDMTMEQLSWFVDDTVTKRLQSIPGMATVQRGGGVDREIMVTLDPARMQSLGVTASQVNLALRSLNLNAAGGKAEIGGSRQSVRVLGNAADAYELSQAEISVGAGKFIKLGEFPVQRNIKEGLFHARVTQTKPLLHEVHSKHHLHRERRAATSAFGHVRTDQRDQVRPRHHAVHLFEKHAPPRALARLPQPKTRLLHGPNRLSCSRGSVADLLGGYAELP